MKLNQVYLKDNLELMKEIPDNYIDLIYCDILYGTGRKFKDYQDLKADRKVIENHYIPRIKEMHRILKDTGSIYLQMDCRINHWIRILMDDVFGYDNFRNEIVWCYNGGGVTDKNFNKKHDVIVLYAKTYKYIYNIQYQAYNDNSTKRLLNKHKGKDKSKKLDRGTPMVDWWINIKCIVNPANKEYVDYKTQKPKALLERIIKASSNENDIVADFYMGSGTSMVVAKELKRKYIGCDISEKAVAITKKRLNAVT